MSIKMNNRVGSYVKSYKGVRQGDLLSPILFNFVADCLTRMVHKAQENGLITGLIDHIIDRGVAILQYADDTFIFLKHDINNANWNRVQAFVVVNLKRQRTTNKHFLSEC